MKFHIVYLDGSETEVVATASALRAFEARHDQPLLFAMGTYKSYWAYELAHASLAQTQGVEADYDTWLDTVESIQREVPASGLLDLAETLGVTIESADAAAVVPTPTGRGAKGRSPEGSSTPRSTRAKASKS